MKPLRANMLPHIQLSRLNILIAYSRRSCLNDNLFDCRSQNPASPQRAGVGDYLIKRGQKWILSR